MKIWPAAAAGGGAAAAAGLLVRADTVNACALGEAVVTIKTTAGP